MFWNKERKEREAHAWARRFEAGAQDEPTLALAARLQNVETKKSTVNPFFKARLRRQLLAQHDDQLIGQQRGAVPARPWPLRRRRVKWAILALAFCLSTLHFWRTSALESAWRYRDSGRDLPFRLWEGSSEPFLASPLVALLPWLFVAVAILLVSSVAFAVGRFVYSSLRPVHAPVGIWSQVAYRGLWLSSVLAILLIALTAYGTNLQMIPTNLGRLLTFQSPLAVSSGDGPIGIANVSPALAPVPDSAALYDALPNPPLQESGASVSNHQWSLGRNGTMATPAAAAIVSASEVAAASVAPLSSASVIADPNTIGLAVGGAQDINNFRENIEQGYLPLPSDVTVEGLFSDYYFNTGQQAPCDQLFCPSYTQATSRDPFSGEPQHFLAVGLNSGIRTADFARKRLNLVVVLDISGSMGEPFTNYYYGDTYRADEIARAQQWEGKSKLTVATEAIVALMDHLRPDDQLGIVLFDNQAHLAKPLRLVGETDMASIKRHVLALRETGNTNVEAGYRMATDLLTGVSSGDPASYENRIIFLTDAQPNSGTLDERVLAGLVQSNAGQRIYTTFIGIGVDFNSTLVEGLTKTRGANYYAVHSPLDFVRRLDDEFDFMVTPLLFDLTLTFNSPDYTIAKVYGSPEADAASGELMRINTLFPSASRGGESKGGLVLLQLQPRHGGTNDGGAATLTVTYADRSGNLQSSVATVILPPTNSGQWQDRYDNDGIRKGILLVRYANLLRNWINDSRAIAAGLDDWRYPSVSTERGIVIPTTPNLGQWERQALPLRVAPDYRALFAAFQRYFANEMGAIGDGTLTQEVTVLEKLSNH